MWVHGSVITHHSLTGLYVSEFDIYVSIHGSNAYPGGAKGKLTDFHLIFFHNNEVLGHC